jgi:hypothetical protein
MPLASVVHVPVITPWPGAVDAMVKCTVTPLTGVPHTPLTVAVTVWLVLTGFTAVVGLSVTVAGVLLVHGAIAEVGPSSEK